MSAGKVSDKCSKGGLVLTSLSGNISSPMFPDVYPPRQTCRWIISAPQGHRVQLSFHTFQLETCLIPFICTCDYVRIRDGNDEKSPSLGKFCGGNKPPFIQSSGRFLWVEFVTDRTRNERGFNATYTNVGMKFVFTLFRPSSDLLTFLQSYLVSQNPRTRKISGGGGMGDLENIATKVAIKLVVSHRA